MKPNFPMFNLTMSRFEDLLDKEFALGYCHKTHNIDEEVIFIDQEDWVDDRIGHLHDMLELFENEINQTIFGDNTHLLRAMFGGLKDKKNYLLSISKANISRMLKRYNKEYDTKFLETVEANSKRYFNDERTRGLKHMQEYEFYAPIQSNAFGNWIKVKRVYHDFYCVEEKPKYIDVNSFVDIYWELINAKAKILIDIIDRYLIPYEAGEYTSANAPTRFKRWKRWVENNLVTASIMALITLGTIGLPFYLAFFKNEVKEIPTELGPSGSDTSINLKVFYTLDNTETRHLSDGDTSTREWNVGTKTATYYLTCLFNMLSGIKKDLATAPEEYFCNKFDMEAVARVSGIRVHNPNVKQHDSIKPNYYNGKIQHGFAYYNPEIIKWAFANLIPNPKEKNIQGFLYQNIYNELYRNNIRLLVEGYLFFPNESTYKAAQSDYLEEMQKHDFNGANYLYKKYGNPKDCSFCYGYPMAIGFWIRRGIDGTNDEVWQGLVKFLNLYDKEWLNFKIKPNRSLWNSKR